MVPCSKRSHFFTGSTKLLGKTRKMCRHVLGVKLGPSSYFIHLSSSQEVAHKLIGNIITLFDRKLKLLSIENKFQAEKGNMVTNLFD